MRKVVLVIGLAVVAVGACTAQRRFGPEWTKVGDTYERKVEVKVVHYAAGNVSNYTLPLEKGEVHVWQVDGDRGFHVATQHPDGRLEIATDDQGNAAGFMVVLGEMEYIDLNGDGVIDAMREGKARIPRILLEGKFVEVANSKSPFRGLTARAVDGTTEYIFEGGKWKVK
jgi:hypothetical protein